MTSSKYKTSAMEKLTQVSSNRIFGGFQKVFSHESEELNCKMNFAVYLPPQADAGKKLPVLFYLSGLTCTEQNFISKSGFQRYAAEHGIVVVSPDTSPRGVRFPGDDESWDFGVSAGFYLDATCKPWSENYRMGSYVTSELYQLVLDAFRETVDADRIGITGHSMGGHGALVSTLRNPGLFKSVSAFAPICNPTQCPWGVKAFSGYLGPDKEADNWAEWDATELVKKYDGPPLTIFIDQVEEEEVMVLVVGNAGGDPPLASPGVGDVEDARENGGAGDQFYEQKQLLPENLVAACRAAQLPVILNLRDGYDHSYYYIATFISEHFDFHAKILKA